ncbi:MULTISPECIES: hypothetical protein [Thalassospira]|uniref:Uncharacterized protein n=1 Tax=Thalassospira xiamenensis TaxID=220697 RepID=A0A367X684_9PROT|nr:MULTISPECIES: hypothetical protein [Thalassospira]KZB51538.1 hypothetical protein AUP41_07450 [Thalassospira xiamenensis]MAZ34311.1 hypothetical protein [Thalassospira sp.]MCK2166555.1 hypothetical protein [Thalassospira xiamenensis]RCK48202.1 hypothetical protein TH44_16955 [Thalassospira xiamenensis]|tara:strand:- start:142 stop:504 length:363 start_codon:yes stop_codon:yes gene_type:complete
MTSINPSQFNVASFQKLGINVANKQVPEETIAFMRQRQGDDASSGKAAPLSDTSSFDPLAANAGAKSRTEAQLIGQQDEASKSTLPTSAEELLTVNEDEEMTDEEKQQKLAQLNKHILQG